jgi:hypothetical protein
MRVFPRFRNPWRARIFNDYRWKHEYWYADTIDGLSTYEVRGPIGDHHSWTKVAPVEREALIEVGTTIDFSTTGSSSRHELIGWSLPEPWGTWSDGPLASLTLHPSAAGPVQLALSAQGFVAGGPMRASVIIDKRLVGELVFDANNSRKEATFAVPREAISDGTITVEFQVAKPRSPKELGMSTDPRKLGIGMHWLRLEPAGPGAE